MSGPLESQVIDVEERLRQAMMHSDTVVIDQLLAPGLLFTNHTGQLLNRDDDLAFHRSGLLRLTELAPSEQHIQLHSGFAVVSVLMHLVGHYDNTPMTKPFDTLVSGHRRLMAFCKSSRVIRVLWSSRY